MFHSDQTKQHENQHILTELETFADQKIGVWECPHCGCPTEWVQQEKTRTISSTLLPANMRLQALRDWLAEELASVSEEDLTEYPDLQQWKNTYEEDRTP